MIGEIVFSALLGGLVGIEREFNRKLKKTTPIGVRTMIFITILGTITSIGGETYVIAGLVGVVAIISLSFYARYQDYDKKGLTTYTASLIMYFTGVLVGKGFFLIALSISAITTALLSFGRELKMFARILTRKELKSTIIFVIIAFVVLPLLPDKVIDSLGLFNPFRYWLLVVLVSSISFASYILLKLFPDGLSLTGFLGGFINAKVTIYELISEARLNKELREDAFNGILLSSTSALLSIFLIAAIGTLNLKVLSSLVPVILTSAVILILFLKGGDLKGRHKLGVRNPFSLSSALKIGFLVFLFMQISYIGTRLADNSMIYLITMVSAFASSFATTAGLVALYNSGGLGVYDLVRLLIVVSAVDVLGRIIVIKLSNDESIFRKALAPFLLWAGLLGAYFFIYPLV